MVRNLLFRGQKLTELDVVSDTMNDREDIYIRHGTLSSKNLNLVPLVNKIPCDDAKYCLYSIATAKQCKVTCSYKFENFAPINI